MSTATVTPITSAPTKRQPQTLAEVLAMPSIYARSAQSSVFTTEEVVTTAELIDSVPLVEHLEKWQKLDAAGKGAGGRPPALNFRALLVAMLLLQKEYTPFLGTELANLFWRRLNSESRELLGIAHVRVSTDHAKEQQLWYKRAKNIQNRMLALIDPTPALRKRMLAEERRYQLSLRDEDVAQTKRERLDWFCNQLLHMTWIAIPEEVRAKWKGSVSVDRTPIPAVSKRGRPSWPRKDGVRQGKEPQSYMMEFDADWYMRKPEERDGENPNARDGVWGYAMNIAVATEEVPGGPASHPYLALSCRMTKPNSADLPEDTIWMLSSLKDRGYPTGRVTGDLEYFALQMPQRLVIPTRQLGYTPLTGYRPQNLGRVGEIGGAIQVEGKLLCPQTPDDIVNATKRYNAGEIDKETYQRQIEEIRPMYEVRMKERPDPKTGAFPIMCPALGSATVDCTVRKLSKTASKKIRDEVVGPPEHLQDKICKQHSVTVQNDAATRYLQEYRYNSEAWTLRHGHDRAQIESYNSIIKDPAKENIENTARRRIRGFTGAYLATVFAMVSGNLRLTRTWYQDEAARIANPAKPFVRNTKPFIPFKLEDQVPTSPWIDDDGVIHFPEKKTKAAKGIAAA
jgi:hypothetical protein